MDRLARNLDYLRKLLLLLNSKQVKIRFIKENLTFTGEDSPMSNLLLSVTEAFAGFERAIIRERQMESINLAKKRGVYKERKKALNEKQLEQIKAYLEGKVAAKMGIARKTLYQYLNNETISFNKVT